MTRHDTHVEIYKKSLYYRGPKQTEIFLYCHNTITYYIGT